MQEPGRQGRESGEKSITMAPRVTLNIVYDFSFSCSSK
jgi:hypothetical protein